MYSISAFAQESYDYEPEQEAEEIESQEDYAQPESEEYEDTAAADNSSDPIVNTASPSPDIRRNDSDPATEYLAKSGTPVNATAWNHEGDFFATSWNNTTIIFESESNTISAIYSNSADDTINPFTDITSLEFSPDDKTLLSVHNNNTAMVHSIGDSGSALITGTGDRLPDAVYVGNSFRMIAPLDAINLYECVRETGTGSYTLTKKFELQQFPLDLASNGEDGKIFVTLTDGTVLLIDTKTWENIGDFQSYNESGIFPDFAPDGKHYLCAIDGNQLYISNITDPEEQYIINEPDGLTYTAIFSSDSKKIIAGTRTGYVRVYDIQTAQILYEFALNDMDAAKTLAASPDGEFVLIGTQKGYIYRWSLNGLQFEADKKRYVDEDGNVYNEMKDSFNISFEYSTLPYYYLGTFGVDVNFRNYKHYPFYWGCGGRIGTGIPKKSFPYSYEDENGKKIREPWAYSTITTVNVGIAWYKKEWETLFFSEAGLGGSVRVLYNNEIKERHFGRTYFGFLGELMAGVQYKRLRVAFGGQYDHNIQGSFKCTIGYSMDFDTLIKLFKRKKPPSSAQQTAVSDASEDEESEESQSF